MELLYTIFFTNFMFLWFSKYNFITCILLLFFLNTIRNVRIYLVNNNINNSTNPFLNGINNLFNQFFLFFINIIYIIIYIISLNITII
jgi:hypothetical protein